MLIRDIADLAKAPITEPAIIYGPYFGEFGHELMRWQGWVRWRLKLDRGTTIAVARATSYCLYGTTHFLPLPSALMDGLDCSGDELYRATKAQREAIRAWIDEIRKYFGDAGIRVIQYPPNYARPDLHQDNYLQRQVFERLGVHGLPANPFGDRRFFMVFIRRRELASGKNIREESWKTFLDWMEETDRHVLIGGIDTHEWLGRSGKRRVLMDLVAKDQPETWLPANIGYLNRAEGSVISESGTMYLSMLAGCATLVYGSEAFKARTERENVLRTDLVYRDMGTLAEVTGEQMIEVFKAWESNLRGAAPVVRESRTHGLF